MAVAVCVVLCSIIRSPRVTSGHRFAVGGFWCIRMNSGTCITTLNGYTVGVTAKL